MSYPHQPGSPQFEGGAAYEAYLDEMEAIKQKADRTMIPWIKLIDAKPPKEHGDTGERWFLTYNEPTGTYDVACIERDLDQGYCFEGFALGVTHWCEITNAHPR